MCILEMVYQSNCQGVSKVCKFHLMKCKTFLEYSNKNYRQGYVFEFIGDLPSVLLWGYCEFHSKQDELPAVW